MSSIWLSFLPYHVAYDLVQHPDADPTTREQRFEAVLLFADIAGFTAMSEALGQMGKPGAEILTAVLNGYFESIIGLIRTYGGIIGKFGGDSITVLFPTAAETRQEVSQRAVQCGLLMQMQMASYAAIETTVGTFTLSMKIGMAIDEILCTSVGQADSRLEYIIAGPALDKCVLAEKKAQAGELIIHDDLLPLLKTAVDTDTATKPRPPSFLQITTLNSFIAADPLTSLIDLNAANIASLRAYVAPTVAERIERGQINFINEHRQLTVMFVRFDGFEYADKAVQQQLQRYMSAVMQIVQRYGGYLNKIEMGDKGSKYIILFGAPIAHEDDEKRALSCALELRDLEIARTAVQPTVGIGIHTGFAYCGLVGAPARREYTAMGQAVIVAARLMQAAEPGQILASKACQQGQQDTFAWHNPALVYVSENAQAIRAYPLSNWREQHNWLGRFLRYTAPMIGRLAEKRRIKQAAQAIQQGEGQMIGVVADAGMGKSRLIAAAVKSIGEPLIYLRGECQSYGGHSRYLVWQPILRDLFGLEAGESVEKQRQQIERHLTAVDPALVWRMPLLQTVLNIPIPDNELTEPLEAKVRKASREALIVRLLQVAARKRPLCLILEDLQWIDPLSLDLLITLARQLPQRPILVLLTYRPTLLLNGLPAITRFTEIALAEFSPEESRQLVAHKTTTTLPEALITQLIERAQGNPFYLDEMLNLIQTQPETTIELPDSLRNLIISRLDQLGEGPKTTLKVASVIGRLFEASWLWGSYPQLGAPERIAAQLTELSETFLTPSGNPEAAVAYLFKHVLTQEVTYESLAVATRQMLHEQIAQFIERQYHDTLPTYLDALAYHYGQSQNAAKQRTYFSLAAEVAQANFANDAALDYYERLLPLLKDDEKTAVLLQLGQIQQLVGQWQTATDTFQQALQLAQSDNEKAACQRHIGKLFTARGNFDEALNWIQKAHAQFQAAENQQDTTHTLLDLGIVYGFQGDLDKALANYEACRALTKAKDDQETYFRAVGNMGILYYWQDQHAKALECFEICQNIALQGNDRLILSRNFGNIGNVYVEQGKYQRALKAYRENLHLAHEIGYQQGVSITIGNIGNVYLEQGECEAALLCNTYNLSIGLELGDLQGIGFALWTIALAYICQHDNDKAMLYLERAVDLCRLLDIPYELSDCLFDLSQLYIQQERYPQALELLAEVLDVGASGGNEAVQFKAQVATVSLWVRLGKIKPFAGVNELRQMLFMAETPEQQTAVHYEIWRIDPTQERDRQQAAALYHHLHAQTPKNLYRQRYLELTETELLNSPNLPPIPDIVANYSGNLDKLLEQVNRLIKNLRAKAQA